MFDPNWTPKGSDEDEPEPPENPIELLHQILDEVQAIKDALTRMARRDGIPDGYRSDDRGDF